MSLKIILFASCLIFILSCSNDNIDSGVSIDPSLQRYFDAFALAGEQRGVLIDYEINGITGVISNINSPGVVGQCLHNEKQPNSVIFDRQFWFQLDTMDREFLVFHELGHCMLNRNHLDSVDSNGNCVSIMHSTIDICPFIYNNTTREAYLDELFNQ